MRHERKTANIQILPLDAGEARARLQDLVRQRRERAAVVVALAREQRRHVRTLEQALRDSFRPDPA